MMSLVICDATNEGAAAEGFGPEGGRGSSCALRYGSRRAGRRLGVAGRAGEADGAGEAETAAAGEADKAVGAGESTGADGAGEPDEADWAIKAGVAGGARFSADLEGISMS